MDTTDFKVESQPSMRSPLMTELIYDSLRYLASFSSFMMDCLALERASSSFWEYCFNSALVSFIFNFDFCLTITAPLKGYFGIMADMGAVCMKLFLFALCKFNLAPLVRFPSSSFNSSSYDAEPLSSYKSSFHISSSELFL